MNSKNRFNWSFILLIVIIMCFLIHSETTICLAQSQLTVEQLINDLACASCHPGFTIASEIREKTPDLSHAGLRYNPAYLFDYLQNPTKVRQHIGYSRMPNFNFREKESLALVLFLETQSYVDDKWPDFPSGLDSGKHKDRAAKAVLIDSLECVKCHELEGNGKNTSTDLTTVGYRLNRQWLGEYLVAPYVFDGPNTKMPSYFYQLASRKGKFIQMLPQAAETIKILVTYLFSLNKDKQIQLQRAYEKAKKAYPDVNAAMGKKIFLSQNCVACHKHALIKPWQEYIAPDLSIEGARVKREWLTAYLQKPSPIRPFGFYPGSGSRMPDFGLSDEEVDLLRDYLSKQTRASNSNAQIFKEKKLSAFSMQKARRILRTKLSCLGCHQLRDEGGRIGPNLSGLKSRLQPAFVYQFIQGPKEILRETIMPKTIMPSKNLELIVNFLLQQEDSTSDSNYLSLTDNPLHFYQGPEQSFSLYVKYCASCHGVDGDGNGYNAKYLPTAPTNYSDRTYMSTRSDDTLFDGIFAGGYILNKSHLMPPWGHTLERSEIRQLVAVLRRFCQCQGPEWSRDNN
ncbi:MAG: c-type cytochrome [bacterium]